MSVGLVGLRDAAVGMLLLVHADRWSMCWCLCCCRVEFVKEPYGPVAIDSAGTQWRGESNKLQMCPHTVAARHRRSKALCVCVNLPHMQTLAAAEAYCAAEKPTQSVIQLCSQPRSLHL